ncbi:MAG TPA: prephenate dehydrogenase/arogenate dehydrogenase family protein [Candidatus Acidoferrales bacterium]|nr:prephenate dehydrogenase/arogenate dehydrogenase family protein [Candidatus Acidoferrales bacterium]
MAVLFRKTVIAGVGLLGASIALAARRAAVVDRIVGYGRAETSLALARERGMIDRYFIAPEEFPADADLLIVATPVEAIVPTVRAFLPRLDRRCIVTDVGSVKGRVVRQMERLVAGRVAFVGAHPIAGSEQWGPEFGSADLFVDHRCILTPTKKTDARALEKIACFWRQLGAKVEFMSPAVHDNVLAVVSHLPHVAAYALVNTLSRAEVDSLDVKAYCAGGFKDITRIASSRPELWRDICVANREALAANLGKYIRELNQLRRWIIKRDGKNLEKEFARANEVRRQI